MPVFNLTLFCGDVMQQAEAPVLEGFNILFIDAAYGHTKIIGDVKGQG